MKKIFYWFVLLFITEAGGVFGQEWLIKGYGYRSDTLNLKFKKAITHKASHPVPGKYFEVTTIFDSTIRIARDKKAVATVSRDTLIVKEISPPHYSPCAVSHQGNIGSMASPNLQYSPGTSRSVNVVDTFTASVTIDARSNSLSGTNHTFTREIELGTLVRFEYNPSAVFSGTLTATNTSSVVSTNSHTLSLLSEYPSTVALSSIVATKDNLNAIMHTTIVLTPPAAGGTIKRKISDYLIIDEEYLPYRRLCRYENKYAFLLHRRFSLYLAGHSSPAISYRRVEVSSIEDMDFKAVTLRDVNEKALLTGGGFNIQAGFNYNYRHVLFLQFARTYKGYSYLDAASLDVETGKTSEGGNIREMFLFSGFGFGYKYVNDHRRLVNAIFESSLLFAAPKDLPDGKRTYTAVALKNGLGLSINLFHSAEVNLLPYFSYDLTSMPGRELHTRFFAFGIDLGVAFRLGEPVKKTE